MRISKAKAVRILSSLIFLGVAIMAWVELGNVEKLGFDPLGETFFPGMITIAIGILAILQLAKELLAKGSPDGLPGGPEITVTRPRLIQALASFATFVLFALTIRNGWISFPYSGVIFCFVNGLIYMSEKRLSSFLLLSTVAIALPVTLDFIFRSFFYVSMP